MPNLAYWGNEAPDPLATCQGYSPPTGAPIAIQLGPGTVTPKVRRTVLMQGQTDVPHCAFDETTYSGSLGRAVLGMRSAIIIMAKAPLAAATGYKVEIETNGQTYAWRFTTAAP